MGQRQEGAEGLHYSTRLVNHSSTWERKERLRHFQLDAGLERCSRDKIGKGIGINLDPSSPTLTCVGSMSAVGRASLSMQREWRLVNVVE